MCTAILPHAHTHTHTQVCVCVCIYIYIYIKQRGREAKYSPQVKMRMFWRRWKGPSMPHHFLGNRLANTGVFVWTECLCTKNGTWNPWIM